MLRIPVKGTIDRKTGKLTVEYAEATPQQVEALARIFAEAVVRVEKMQKYSAREKTV